MYWALYLPLVVFPAIVFLTWRADGGWRATRPPPRRASGGDRSDRRLRRALPRERSSVQLPSRRAGGVSGGSLSRRPTEQLALRRAVGNGSGERGRRALFGVRRDCPRRVGVGLTRTPFRATVCGVSRRRGLLVESRTSHPSWLDRARPRPLSAPLRVGAGLSERPLSRALQFGPRTRIVAPRRFGSVSTASVSRPVARSRSGARPSRRAPLRPVGAPACPDSGCGSRSLSMASGAGRRPCRGGGAHRSLLALAERRGHDVLLDVPLETHGARVHGLSAAPSSISSGGGSFIFPTRRVSLFSRSSVSTRSSCAPTPV